MPTAGLNDCSSCSCAHKCSWALISDLSWAQCEMLVWKWWTVCLWTLVHVIPLLVSCRYCLAHVTDMHRYCRCCARHDQLNWMVRFASKAINVESRCKLLRGTTGVSWIWRSTWTPYHHCWNKSSTLDWWQYVVVIPDIVDRPNCTNSQSISHVSALYMVDQACD